MLDFVICRWWEYQVIPSIKIQNIKLISYFRPQKLKAFFSNGPRKVDPDKINTVYHVTCAELSWQSGLLHRLHHGVLSQQDPNNAVYHVTCAELSWLSGHLHRPHHGVPSQRDPNNTVYHVTCAEVGCHASYIGHTMHVPLQRDPNNTL